MRTTTYRQVCDRCELPWKSFYQKRDFCSAKCAFDIKRKDEK